MSFINKKILKNNWRWLVLLILAIFFFLGTSSFNYLSQDKDFVKWLSPDETANYVFSKFYGQEGELVIFEKYNLYVGDIIQPRSFRSDFGFLKPVSFLGIILIYGKIVSLTSYKILPFLTPFFGAIGILFFYLLVKKIFNRNIAFISALLLTSFPVYIYYSARSMFHNILFMTFLIISLYFLVLMSKKKKNTKEHAGLFIVSGIKVGEYGNLFFASLAGIFMGLAVITRTSELLWIVPMLFVLWIFNIKKVGVIKLFLFISFLFLSVLPIFYWNQVLYGSPLNGGYPEMNKTISNITTVSSDVVRATVTGEFVYMNELFGMLKDNIFFFGFHPRDSLKRFYYYFVVMFPWLFWSAIVGFLLFLQKWKKIKKKHLAFLSSYVVVSLILLFYYGSWKFTDNPDPRSFTIGNSYTRYWLPIYLGAMPFASIFILRFTKLLKNKILILISRVVIISLIFFVSIQFVLLGSSEGLIITSQKQKEWKTEFDSVLNLTESNSVIITRYHDKLFFPERKVIVGLFNDDNMVSRYSVLVDYLPVYYYNFTLPQKDIDYLNNGKLGGHELEIKVIENITEDFTLYRIERKIIDNKKIDYEK